MLTANTSNRYLPTYLVGIFVVSLSDILCLSALILHDAACD